MRSRILVFAVLFVAGSMATDVSRVSAAKVGPESLETEFDAILGKIVESGAVDYAALEAAPGPLDSWLSKVATIPKEEVDAWTADQQVAFYINAYNGLVLSVVRSHYPIQGTDAKFPANSIQQIPDVWTTPHRVASQNLSLDQLEKQVLIGRFINPRIHFALNCASRGCPPLRAQAYRGATLNSDLDRAAQNFIRSPHGAQVDVAQRLVRISSLFDWYSADFAQLVGTAHALREGWGEIGSSLEFVADHLPEAQSRFVREASFTFDFLSYDWTLNE